MQCERTLRLGLLVRFINLAQGELRPGHQRRFASLCIEFLSRILHRASAFFVCPPPKESDACPARHAADNCHAWMERTFKCGFLERFAMENLGHNSKAVHRTYARPALSKSPSLDEYEASANPEIVKAEI